MPETYGTRPLSWYAEQTPPDDEPESCWNCGDTECRSMQWLSGDLKTMSCEEWEE
jgi:hypothetical protein